LKFSKQTYLVVIITVLSLNTNDKIEIFAKDTNVVIADTVNVIIETDSIWIDDDHDGYAQVILDGSSSWHLESLALDSFVWTWNDEVIGTDSVITYLFSSGNHTIKLTVVDENGISNSDSGDIVIYAFKTKVDGKLNSLITSIGDSLFMAYSVDNVIYQWNSYGNITMKIFVDDTISNAITVYQSLIYVPTIDSGLYAFDMEGNRKYRVRLGKINHISIGISFLNSIYIGNINGIFYQINGLTGSIVLSFNTGAPVAVTAVQIDHGAPYVNGPDGSIMEIRPGIGKGRTFYITDDSITSPLATNYNRIYFGDSKNKLFNTTETGNVPSHTWNVELTSKICSSPVIGLGPRPEKKTVYVETMDGMVHAVNDSGVIIWDFDTKTGTATTCHDSPIILSDDRIAVYNRTGEIFLLDLSGNIDWQFKTGGAIKNPPLATQSGYIHVVSADSFIYGLALPNYISTDAIGYRRWSTFQGNNQRMGWPWTITTDVDEETIMSDIQYQLEQNYPNPFNPSTRIKYTLPRSSDVSLIIYNILGEEVIRLVDEFQPAGEYHTTWNASNVSSGIYFYRLQAGDFVLTRKMVLLK